MASLRRLAAVLLAALTAPAVAAGPASASAHALISGSGSSWASNAVNQWVADAFASGIQVVYTGSGSAQGRADFAHAETDFAVSDLPFQGGADTSGGRAFAYVPLVGGGLGLTYHLEVDGRLVRNLRLSSATLFKIFTGQVRYWDDAAIAADNPDLALPNRALTPVVHGEGSATSYLLSEYFDTLFPTAWQTFNGAHGPTEYYPAVTDGIAENGSDSVMNFVKSSAGNGSIGYVEKAYADGANYPMAQLANASHHFVAPTAGAVTVALSAAAAPAEATAPTDFRPAFTDTDARAYPLSSYGYAVVPTAADDPQMTTAKRQTLVDFIGGSLCTEQSKMGAIGYAPLPQSVISTAFDRLKALHTADLDVDVSALDASRCGGTTVPDTTRLIASPGATVAYRAPHRLAVTLLDSTAGGNVPAAAVRLIARPAGATAWHSVGTLTTDGSGRAELTVRPAVTTLYQWKYAGDGGHTGTSSAVVTLRAGQAVSLHLTRHSVAAGHAILAWGTVHPSHTGRRVLVEQLVHTHWRVIGTPTVRYQRLPDGRRTAGYVLRVRPGGHRGEVRLRTVAPATPTNVATTSDTLRLAVR